MRQHQPKAFAVGPQQLAAAVILPTLGEPGDTCFQRVPVGDHRCTGLGANEVVDARQRAVGQHGREFERAPVQCRHQLQADLHTQFGVVAVAWHKHQGRGKATKRVAAQEQPCTLALLQPQDADGVFGQGGGVDLEQLVARVHVENRLQRLGSMAVGHYTGDADHMGGAPAHQRYVGHSSGVGGRCVKPQET